MRTDNETLITGATGFIGTHLATALAERGELVRCLVRESSPRPAVEYLRTLGADLVSGDLRDRRSLQRAVDGIDTVFHLGGGGRIDTSEEECRRINVDGTRNLLDACAGVGAIGTFVHASTCAVMGDIGNPPADETHPCNPEDMPYARAKMEAEKLALAYGDQIPVVVVRFPGVYGPPLVEGELARIEGVTPMSLIISAVKRGRWRYIGDGQNLVHWIHVRDVVQGLQLAAQRGRRGEVYILAGERPVTMEGTVGLAARILGVEEPRRQVPVSIARGFAVLSELRARISGGQPRLSRRLISGFLATRAFNITKARQELGFEPEVGLEEGLAETIRWYDAHGYLDAGRQGWRRAGVHESAGATSTAPVVRVRRSFSRLWVQILTAFPEAHQVRLEYLMSGAARIFLDGRPFADLRVILRDKVVEIPLVGNPSHTLSIRLDGTIRPRAEVRFDGVPLGGLL